jgi:hypothetical protein
MSVSSVALSSLTTSPPPQPLNTVTPPASAKDGTVAPQSQSADKEESPQKAMLPAKVGQVIDISA